MDEENKNISETKEVKRKSKEIKKKYHIIEKGETRWHVLKKYGISIEQIEKLNPNFEGKWLGIKEGDKIRVK